MKQTLILEKFIPGVVIALVMTVIASCSKWDDFKKYTDNGAVFYTGKLDSVKILSGKGRVRIQGVLKSDPKIVRCKIYWNDRRDSAEYELPVITNGKRIFDEILSVDEGVKNFVIYTFDKEGNSSVAVNVIGTSYGETYRRRLNNRLINSIGFASGNTTITWEQMDLSTGGLQTETEYVVGGNTITLKTPVSESTTVLTGFNHQTTRFRYRTIFKPDTSSIDTFATAYTIR